MLNCKQGNLAVVVCSTNNNEGKIVRCLLLVMGHGSLGYGPRWVTDPPMRGRFGSVCPVLDSCLRPIRGQDGKDEMLRIVGRPIREAERA